MLTREFIQEGVNDPNIFKAVFMAGGSGSGKTFVAYKLGLQAAGLRTINNDNAFEVLLKKHKLNPKMPDEEKKKRDIVRDRAKEITNEREKNYLQGRLGLIIDGTAKDPEKITKTKAALEALGYQTMMVLVDTSLPVALQRNRERERSLPDAEVERIHTEVQVGKDALQQLFGSNFVVVLNDKKPDFKPAYKKVQSFLRQPLTPTAQDWVQKNS